MRHHLALALFLSAVAACGGEPRFRPAPTVRPSCASCPALDYEAVCYASSRPADCTPGETPECWEGFAVCVEEQGEDAGRCWRTCTAAEGWEAGPHVQLALGQECGGECGAQALRCRATASSSTAEAACSMAYAPCLQTECPANR